MIKRTEFLQRAAAITGGVLLASVFPSPDRVKAQGPDTPTTKRLKIYIVQPADEFNAIAKAFGLKPQELAKINGQATRLGIGNLRPGDLIRLPDDFAVGYSPSVLEGQQVPKPGEAQTPVTKPAEKGTLWNPDTLIISEKDQYVDVDPGTEKFLTVDASVFSDGHKFLINVGAVKDNVVKGTSASIDQMEMRLYSPLRKKALLDSFTPSLGGDRPPEDAEAHRIQPEDKRFNLEEETYGFNVGSNELKGNWLIGILNKQDPNKKGKQLTLIYRVYNK